VQNLFFQFVNIHVSVNSGYKKDNADSSLLKQLLVDKEFSIMSFFVNSHI